MNETPVKIPKKYVSMIKLLKNEKLDIVKTGFLSKRSKYLKLWKKRYIILTNKNLYTFVNEEKTAECTLILYLKECCKVENADEKLDKQFTFSITDKDREYFFQAENEIQKNQWLTSIKYALTNPGVVYEQDEIDYMNDPDRTKSFIMSDED